jgi:hydroxymethylglutaryl-CoA synthase
MDTGIDHIAVYSPNQYLALEDLALARNIDPNKFLVGLGMKEMSIASSGEDVVVMAANAGKQVLEEANVSPKDIGLFIVGTESANDRAKPTATHVHELLEIGNACRVYDVIHACAGGTYGLLSALDWLRNKKNKYALVIASDIARYGKGSAGEPTQGAGAVAMLLSQSPRLMALEEMSVYSKNVHDFWRPWDKEYPIVDGVYSTFCYLEAISNCFKDQDIRKEAAFLYHTPYLKLTQHAHAKVVSSLSSEMDWKQHYTEKVAPYSVYSSRIGNIYTGSLWLSLVNLIENFHKTRENSVQQSRSDKIQDPDCYLFSYGSGCGSVLMQGHFSEEWPSMARLLNVEKMLNDRARLTVEEYELLIDGKMISTNYPNSGYFKFDGIQKDKRQYSQFA